MAEARADSDIFDQQQCQPCLKINTQSTADIYCVQCSEYQCGKCASVHDNDTNMRNHTSISVLDEQNGDDEEITRFKCQKHNSDLEYYCKEEDGFLCNTCANKSYWKCEKIKNIGSMDGHSGCEKLKNELVSAIKSRKQITELFEEADKRLSDGISTLPYKFEDMIAPITQIFNDFSETVLTQATTYSNITRTGLAEKKVKCDTQITTLKRKVKTIDSIMKSGTPAEKIITVLRMKSKVKKAVEETTKLENDMSSVIIQCPFGQNILDLRSKLSSFLESEKLDISLHLPAPSTLQLIKSFKLQKFQDDVDEPVYSGLDFLPDGRMVVTDNQNKKCLIYDVNLNVKSSYKLSYNPLSVTAISNDEVVVTSGDSLDFLNVSKTNDITLNRTCKMNAKCYSISMMKDASFLVGTIDHIKPFRIVSMSGGESDVSINLPDKKFPIDTSFCKYIIIRGREKVVHCDRDDNTIYIYDIRSRERVVVNHDLIQAPSGVAVGPYNHIFVGSNSTKCLVEITPCGRVLSSHQVNMKYPQFVAISEDKKHLVVSGGCVGEKKLSLYKIS